MGNRHINILVTGASGNLGAATVEKFLKEGCHVSAMVSHGKKLTSQKRLSSYHADLVKDIEAASAVEKIISDHKNIYGAALTVGGFVMGTIESTSGDDIAKMIDLNFKTAYHVVRPLLKHFKEEKFGRLILVGAKPALEPNQGQASIAYTLSKTLVFKLAELINADVSGLDIKATVIVPEIIDTPTNREAMPNADFSKWLLPEAIAQNIFDIIMDKRNERIVKLYLSTQSS